MSTWTSDPESDRLPEIITRVPWWHSIRVRTAISISLLAALLVGAVGLVLSDLAVGSGKSLLRQQAVAQLEADVAVFGFGGAPPPGVVVKANQVPAVLLQSVRSAPDATVITWDDGRSMWAARAAQPTGVIAVAVSNAPLRQQIGRITATLAWIIAAAVLFSALTAWIVADRLTIRLREAAASVNGTIRGEETSIRQQDEVGVMTAALASTASALANRLRREQAFTSDVAHDLRTPLTALVSASELLDDGPAAQRVRRQVARMRTLVEELLELARADQRDQGTAHPVALYDVLHDALDQLAPTEDCVLHIHGNLVVRADQARLRSAIVNLVHNARRHGRPPVEIDLHASSIIISDHGNGYPPPLLEQGPRRFSALGNSGGSGLGLAIVMEHVHAAGGRLILSATPDGGARAELRFPPAPQADR